MQHYCARPPFSGEKLTAISTFGEKADAMRLHYDVNKNPQNSQPPLSLTATELLDKLAHLIPPPRRHRHHYHGMLAPNSKYRSRITQFANLEFKATKVISHSEIKSEDFNSKAKTDSLLTPKKSSIGWAKLIRKVYEVDPLKCEQCGETMKIIAYILIQESATSLLVIGAKKEKRRLRQLDNSKLN